MIGNLYKLNLVVLITVSIGAPEPPVILDDPYQVTAVSVNLTWRSGFNGGSTQTFNVQYKKSEDADFISDGQVFQDPGYQANVSYLICLTKQIMHSESKNKTNLMSLDQLISS